MLRKIKYADLNDRQKENFNFQKIAAVLADYGFNCIRLSDDWKNADFLACHVDGKTILRVQLKARLTTSENYLGKDIHIAFPEQGQWYLFPHDDVYRYFLDNGRNGGFSCHYIPEKHKAHMEKFQIG